MGNLCSISITIEDIVHCWDCIVGQASYTCKLEDNLKALGAELAKLNARRNDVKRKVDLAEQQCMELRSEVQLWLSEVQTATAEAEALIENGPQEIQKLCFAGCFSKNCKSSYNFGKQVTRNHAEIDDLWKRGGFETVAENELAPRVDVRPTEPTVGLEPTLDKVWRLLEENNVGIIGLHGSGGVGKTTLLTQINNKLSNNLIGYDVVIWVVVSKDHTIEKVQEKIGEKLGLSNELWKTESCDKKATDIFRKLSKKKFVLLLDDVWERVDLTKVGIPAPNQGNSFKLIFTTRFLEVCGEMGAHEKIKVECLSKDEAWKLFEKKVGEKTLDSHPDIRGLAKQVAAKCGGLPLALITIGRAMACKTIPHDWKYAIEVLKESPHKLAKMDQQVYSLLKFTYDSLPNDLMRSCLLYCSLYPEDYKIGVIWLIDYWFCEGFLDEFDNISRARMQGYSIINFLCNACLLERCEDAIFVKMHDEIRDMALWIARECEAPEKKFLVRGRVKLNTTYDIENWKGVRMSLSCSGIEYLRGTPRCLNLQTLFLNQNNLMMISDGLFQFMRNLRVLSLYANFSLCELPKGISNLVSLECLNLSHTGIMELPIELNRLSKLKVLNLHETLQLQKIPRQLICKFSALQVFGMSVLFDISEDLVDEDNVLNGDHEGLIEELKCLQHLNELNIEIRSVVALESLLSCHNLRRCTERLFLRDLSKRKVLDILSLTHMEHLESLIIRFCESMEEIVIRKIEKAPYFHTLKRVSLLQLQQLERHHVAYSCSKINAPLCSVLLKNGRNNK
ncbi:PREDICTED: probable disease resistance protein At1g12280 [Theobroma cacao]|uniref:Probable disease resistance protein At1g12280 n=1 Tax=Theobroma cacao TaxID=3641 RepID=A0AB32WNF9_THECC|nr:PREDICTED: probable disease resistance protein At1g12280 [Theobroma cacao]